MSSNTVGIANLARWGKWLVLLLVLGVLVYRMKFAPVPVVGHTARLGPMVAEVLGTGTLEARVKTTISPRIQERLAEVLADQNEPVRAGQLLARLEDGELKRQVEVAQAGLAAAQATAARVQVDEQRAEAVALQARQEHKRVVELLATRVSAQADLDKAVENLGVAEADLKRAHSAIAEASSQVAMAETTLAYHNERLGFAQLLSPYDGLVVRRDRDPGAVVVPGSSVLQLIATNQIWVSAWVDETAVSTLATGQTARVIFRSTPDRPYEGEVARLGREADRETREFLVDVHLKELPAHWTLGQRAEVFIESARKAEALILPQHFVHWQGGKPGVFVNAKGQAKWREVTLGLRGRGAVEIAQGIEAGEQVVAPRDRKQPPLLEGMKIKVEGDDEGRLRGPRSAAASK